MSCTSSRQRSCRRPSRSSPKGPASDGSAPGGVRPGGKRSCRLHEWTGISCTHTVSRAMEFFTVLLLTGRRCSPLPMKTCRHETRTHDCIRHGTTTPFAALNILDDTVIGQHYQRQLQEEFISFLDHTAAFSRIRRVRFSHGGSAFSNGNELRAGVRAVSGSL